MKLQMFAVYDSAVTAYMPPFFTRSKGEALRSFSDACNSKDSNFNKYAADYTLYFVGEYDDVTANFFDVVPVRIVGARECLVDGFDAPEVEAVKLDRRMPM
ncbi:nonstructural protein [robinz microvirus RP_117]|nr:nonstructural protein [robinz microvirus RP_117]